jgi:anaerobic selenocysteine-containing dehydrogenase
MAVAARIGPPVADRLPVVEPEALIKQVVARLHAGAGGEPFGAPLEEAWTRLLEQSGWRVPHDGPFEAFWATLRERGGWWDPVYYRYEWRRVLATPSGRFELASQRVAGWLASLPAAEREVLVGDGPASLQGLGADRLGLPAAVRERAAGDDAYDLEVNPYTIPILSGLAHTNEPWLQDITGFHLYRNWETWVEIHPQTAGERGFGDGERVWVESPAGRLRARLRYYPGAMPGVINLPVGLGHTTGGRWTAGIGDAVQQILATAVEPLTGATIYRATRARLLRMEER